MRFTEEQTAIIDHVVTTEGLTAISAVAGSGKTTLLIGIAERLNPASGLYLAYNKAIATEASYKFHKNVACLTTHALAYKSTVVPLKLKLGLFNTRSITEQVTYEIKQSVVDYLREFCLSKYTSFDTFAYDYSVPATVHKLVDSYLGKMQEAKIECTHDFYLKLFHIMLSTEDVSFETLDLVTLDEAGDTNEVTLEIFKLLPARRKVMVGDPYQNIYAFNHTINCFDEMKDEGRLMPMSQSFRVSEDIAKRIQKFCNTFISTDLVFRGVKLTDHTIKTKAYIARTNASLIGKMIGLNNSGVSFGLTRTPQQIFDPALALCGLKYKGFISDPSFRYLQHDVDYYFEHDKVKNLYPSALSYLGVLHPEDVNLQQTISLIRRYSPKEIIKCYQQARTNQKTNQTYTLGTAHSTKGLEFDEVTIADDLNSVVSTALEKSAGVDVLTTACRSELNLYYVACSRAKKVLHNATMLGVCKQDFIDLIQGF